MNRLFFSFALIALIASCSSEQEGFEQNEQNIELRSSLLGFPNVATYKNFVAEQCAAGNHENCCLLDDGTCQTCPFPNHEGCKIDGLQHRGAKHGMGGQHGRVRVQGSNGQNRENCDANCTQDCSNCPKERNNCDANCKNDCGNCEWECNRDCNKDCENCGNRECNNDCNRNCENCGDRECNNDCNRNCENCGDRECNNDCNRNCENCGLECNNDCENAYDGDGKQHRNGNKNK